MGDNQNQIKHVEIYYNNDLEQLLAQSAEECESLGILHLASYEKYNKLSNIINIPVIILSSGIGFITGIDLNYDKMNIILGIGSVFVGIIKSIDSYFQLGKRAESHRMCALQYTQINKKIQIELSLCREQRQTAKDMLSIIKTDIKNLQDISPVIDQEIIKEYNLKYGKYKNVKKPNFVNGLSSVKVNANSLEQEMAAARSIPHSIQSGAPSRAMSVSGLGENQHQQHPEQSERTREKFNNFMNGFSIPDSNLNMNDVSINIPFQTFPYENGGVAMGSKLNNSNNNNISLMPNLDYAATLQTPPPPPHPSKPLHTNSGSVLTSASARLVYANPNKSNSNSQPSQASSLVRTPFSSSPISSFRLQQTSKSSQQQEQLQYNNAVVTPTNQSSRLSTPQLLDYYHNPNEAYLQQQQQQQQQNENGDNEMNLVIDIPDAVEININNNNDNNNNPDQNMNGSGSDYQPSPTNSQLGNM